MAYVFTAYNGVRALLGVSIKELPDAVLSDDLFANKLRLELVGVDAAILDTYAAAQALDTDAALNFVAAFDVFSAQAMALFCLAGLPLFSPKSVTDGKAGFSRDAGAPYKSTVERLTAEFSQYKQALLNALGVFSGGVEAPVVPLTFVGSSAPTFDPVTGA